MISAFACSSFWQLEDDQRDENEIEKKKKNENGRGKRTYKAKERGKLVTRASDRCVQNNRRYQVVYVAKLGFRATGRVIDGRAAPLFTGTKKGGKGQPF